MISMHTETKAHGELASEAKTRMVIDMAIDFAAMTRVLEKNSNPKIFTKLQSLFDELNNTESQASYDQLHADFCAWFMREICTAEKKWKGRVIKQRGPCSYGHAAKVIDIAAKVYVYYCNLPSSETASALLPLLHGAIDNQILEHLRTRFPETKIKAESISEVGRAEYDALQSLVAREIRDDFGSEIFKVQYDDILFLRLNREDV